MGNCQATTAAAIEVEHPSGKKERFYWPMLARQLMLQNPGHYVALFSQQLPGCTAYSNTSFFGRAAEVFAAPDPTFSKCRSSRQSEHGRGSSRPRLKLMPPDAPLAVGSTYRLVTFEEALQFSYGRSSGLTRDSKNKVFPDVPDLADLEDDHEVSCRDEDPEEEEEDEEEDLLATLALQAAYPRSIGRQQWRPALQSIAEAGG